MDGLNFFVIDLETTGVNSKLHETIEVSIIRVSTRVQLTEFIRAEMPEVASIDALQIQNKTFEDLLKGKSKEEVVEKIEKFINEDGLTPSHRCFIGHNSSFDRRFIHALFDKVGKQFPGSLWADTMAMSRHYAKTILGIPKPKVNLHASMDLVGLKKIATQHASKADTRNTFMLWKDLTEAKKIDYLPFIKTEPHILLGQEISESEEMELMAEGL
jgi:DNA polymerase III epsilon subunit-like protein